MNRNFTYAMMVVTVCSYLLAMWISSAVLITSNEVFTIMLIFNIGAVAFMLVLNYITYPLGNPYEYVMAAANLMMFGNSLAAGMLHSQMGILYAVALTLTLVCTVVMYRTEPKAEEYDRSINYPY